MIRFRAMRDTLGFDLAVIAVGMIATVIALLLITTNRGVM